MLFYVLGYCLPLEIDQKVPGHWSAQYALNFHSLRVASQPFPKFSAKPIPVGAVEYCVFGGV